MANWANLPNITHTEMAVLAAAVLLLFVAPALLSWSDERRRRRAERAALAAQLAQIAPSVESAAPDLAVVAVEASLPETQPSTETAAVPTPAVGTMLPTNDAPLSLSENALPPSTAPQAADVASGNVGVPMPAELQPLSGVARHRFRLDDLHRAELPDWPPAAIRDDPERSRLRREAEHAAAAYEGSVKAASIASPYPARSHCLGAADADASEVRLSFLLFPVVWPVSQNQAVAQAVFRIDRVTGEVRGWVDPLRPQELSEENRREIREAGGEA